MAFHSCLQDPPLRGLKHPPVALTSVLSTPRSVPSTTPTPSAAATAARPVPMMSSRKPCAASQMEAVIDC